MREISIRQLLMQYSSRSLARSSRGRGSGERAGIYVFYVRDDFVNGVTRARGWIIE